MSKWILSAFIALLGAVLVMPEAEARRLGGGRAVGTQRNVTPPPSKAPAQQHQQAAPAQQNPQPAAAPQAPGSRWGAILGGLAIGGLLGYLFAGNGLMGILLLVLLAVMAALVVRALMQRRTAEAPRPVQFAGLGGQTMMPPPSSSAGLPVEKSRLPADFDAAAFLRGAKMNFVKLQLANDRGELDAIREFTTDEVFEQVKGDIQARAGSQQTDIGSLDAEIVDVAAEKDRFWVTVRFSGLERVSPQSEPSAFEEMWHLAKPADGSSGWLLAGIQQRH